MTINTFYQLKTGFQLCLGEGSRNRKRNSKVEPYFISQLEPNFDGIFIGWAFSKIVSGSHALPPRWLPQ
jgi:hypothetical protein